MPRKVSGVTKRGDRWRARYYDAAGVRHEKTFGRWEDARDWRAAQLAAVTDGSWVDPSLGKETFRQYAERWRQGSGFRGQSGRTVESRLRVHAYPSLGDRPLREIRHSEIRAWLADVERTVAPWTAYGVHSIVRGVFASAVEDRVLNRSPFEKIKLKTPRRQEPIVPMTVEQVRRLLDHTGKSHFRAIFALGAGTGLRGSELRGLTLDDVDFLRRTVTCRYQLVDTIVDGRSVPAWGPPKTPASSRTLDVPQWALDEVSAHLARVPAKPVTLPVVDWPGQTTRTAELLFTTATGRPIRRTGLAAAWNAALVRAGLTKVKGQGAHALRHHVASLLIAAGESVKVVQAQLGHATARETLETYAHLFPDSDGRVRKALQSAWQAVPETPTDAHGGGTGAEGSVGTP